MPRTITRYNSTTISRVSPFFLHFNPMAREPNLSDFAEEFRSLGAKPEHIRRIWRAWLGLGSWTPPQSVQFPARLREALPNIQRRLESLVRFDHLESQQKDAGKLLVHLADGECVEAVLLPRQAVCISTQVGCAVGCIFCMTGRCGLIRQLSSSEIVAQVVVARRIRPDIKKVVFMGMGEPSHNLKAVMEAVEFLGDVAQFQHKQLVISTVGDERLFETIKKARVFETIKKARVKPALALSLHTTDSEKRKKLLPNARPIPVEVLLREATHYARMTKYPLQIEWTLMEGINDSFEEVERLADQIEGELAMVNFIAVNPIEDSYFRRPTRTYMEDLITGLRQRGIVATIRESAAQDIDGGCGQLRAKRFVKWITI